VSEKFLGQTVWVGDVEVFDLEGHPQGKRCFAWGFKDDAGKWHYVAVISPPIKTATDAVRAYIIQQAKKNPPM
jgi:hypothetical protein